MKPRNLLAVGNGVGISIEPHRLRVVVVRVWPNTIRVLATLDIPDWKDRPAAVWGTEYRDFVSGLGLDFLTATVVLPRTDVIVRYLTLPGLDKKDLGSAISYQLDSLHPWGDADVESVWEQVSPKGDVQLGLVRRTVLDSYRERFEEAGIAVGSVTHHSSVLYHAVRFRGETPAPFLASVRAEGDSIELYGESQARPVFSAEFDTSAERAIQLAAAELRLDEAVCYPIGRILPFAEIPPAVEVPVDPLAFAAALAGACSWLAPATNLLPTEFRKANSRRTLLPTAALGLLLLLAAGTLWGYSAWSGYQYRKTLQEEINRLQPLARRAANLDKSLEDANRRVKLLDQFRSQAKSELDVLEELTRILEPPIWTSQIQINADSVSLTGEAEQAAQLLTKIDASPFFTKSAFVYGIVRQEKTEIFRIRTEREK